MKCIKLNKNMETIVDDDMYDYLNQFKWRVFKRRNKYYVQRSQWLSGKNKGTSITLHRVIMNAPTGILVDHINGNTLDNRKENLRLCTSKENIRNSGMKNNKTGFKGVKKRNDLNTKPYSARIMVDYKDIHLGYFETAEEAAEAYNKAAIKYFGEFANLNKL